MDGGAGRAGSVHPQVLLHYREHLLGRDELDGDAILEVADDAGTHAAERDGGAHGRADGQLDGGAGEGDVDDLAVVAAAVVEDDGGMPDVGDDALVPAVLGQVENVLVRQPRKLGRHLVALAAGGDDLHGEAALDQFGDGALDAAEVVEIGDDLLADSAGDGGDDLGVTGRHLQHLAGKFATI